MARTTCTSAVVAMVFGLLVLSPGCTPEPVSSGKAASPASPARTDKDGWRDTFSVDKANLADSGKNPYFMLTPGHRLHYKGGDEELTITVLNETKVVDGVKTRIVEERESEGGQLVEVSRNYFAIDAKTNDVYYFGEDVDVYKDGKIVRHEGAWLSGVNGAKFGLIMPGNPKAGDKFYQELAPGVAMDRCEILSVSDEITTRAGKFKNVLKVRDSSAIEKGSEIKYYAPGVGLVKEKDLELTEGGVK